MRTLNPHDLVWCVRRLPKPIVEMMKLHGDEMVVAGGFIRSCVAGEPINDVDIFTKSKERAKEFAETLAEECKTKVHETDNAYTVRIPGRVRVVQFIHRWTFSHPTLILESFDFTIAQAGIWFDSLVEGVQGPQWIGMVSDTFYEDLASKRLIYTSPVRNEDAGGSMLRLLKFYQRGYRVPLDSLGAVIARLAMGIDYERLERLESAGLTTEQACARVITAKLVEVDPIIDPTRGAHIPALHDNADLGGEA